MGNYSSTEICNARLKTKKYPSNIPEKEWKPIEALSHYTQGTEGIISSNGDQRIRAMPNDYIKYGSLIYNIGRLKMQYSSNSNQSEQKNTEDIKINSYHFGTGFIIHHQLNTSFVLTAAHNLVHIERYQNNKLSFPKHMWFQVNENKYKGFQTISTYPIVRRYIHPKYIEYCKNKDIPAEATGFDIAIVEVLDTTKTLQKIKPFQIRSHKSPMLNYSDIKIAGFAGEESKLGELYGMKGNCKIKYLNDQIKINKLIVYYNIDTSHGQSGSPIFNVKTNLYNDDHLYGSYNEIIGVHVAEDKKNKYNFGTLINDDILKWIYDVIGVYRNESDNYPQCNALLITSSKTKYAKCLNTIHKKFVKTTIINTVKLYYDYNDYENANNVTKADILKCIKNIFNHSELVNNQEDKSKRFIIYFCGESDGHGNWIINNDINDVITLNDILGLYGNYIRCKRRLYIISDCPQSGNWVKEYVERKEQIGLKGIVIQASCQNEESCKIGVFTEKYAGACLQWGPVRTKKDIPRSVSAYLAAVVGSVTVGVVYDGIIKQPIHKITKTSQPMSSVHWNWINHIGETHHGWEVRMYFYNSWSWMDQTITFESAHTIGGFGQLGLV